MAGAVLKFLSPSLFTNPIRSKNCIMALFILYSGISCHVSAIELAWPKKESVIKNKLLAFDDAVLCAYPDAIKIQRDEEPQVF